MLTKDLLKEIDNEISDEELIAICNDELILEKKELKLEHFIYKMKELNYRALPHIKYIKKYLPNYKKYDFFNNNKYINVLLKHITQMELAEHLLFQGATLKEIKLQTDIPNELLAVIIRKNYDKMPKEILRFRLINYRILKLAKLQALFFKETIMPLLKKQDTLLAHNLLTSFEDLIKMNVQEKMLLEGKLNEKDED